MTVTVRDEVEINGQKYRIRGDVKGSWIDPFPEQFTLGDPNYSNRRDLSSWIINDLRDGIGVEEMDERIDGKRCWWSNCIIKYRNHILPPRLATAITTPTSPSAGWTNPDSADDPADWANEADAIDGATGTDADISDIGVGTYSEYCIFSFTSGYIYGDSIRYYGISDGNCDIDIDAYYDGAWNNVVEHAYVDQTYTATALGANKWVKQIRVRFKNARGGGIEATNLAVIQIQAVAVTLVPSISANFNGNLYYAFGTSLYKMNAGRTAFTLIYTFGDTITALIPSLNSRLYIYLGDSENYYYMNTGESVTQSDSANANWGFQHDAKLFKVNTSGTVEYSTDPDGGGPTWASGGAIDDIAAQIEGFVVGRDAAGTIVPYAATNSIIKAYDDSTPQWVDTEAKLPNHPIGGKGHAYWNGKTYFSYGLGVKEYYPETGAFIDIGLTERDGLPVEYNGETTKLLGDTGVKGMFAAIDASVTSGNSKSGLYLYDGGWQCWWVDTSNNGAMNDIIVSSASSGYAVYWDCGGTVYYIDIPRGIENPDKITQSYATSGILITPWFDAGNPVAAKLAKSLHTFAKGVTATETVALKYRVDHDNTDLDTGWTTLDTLNSAGENDDNEELITTGAGASFKAIQFRLDFVTAGSTSKADIQSLVFYHKKRTGLEKIRVWDVTVICDDYGLTKAKEKVANLKSAIESAIDVLFSHRPNDASTESYYVTVDCPSFSEETGREYSANYQLRLTES